MNARTITDAATGEIIDDEGGLPALVDTDGSLAIGLSRAEIDTQIATARRFPRDLKGVRNRLLSYVTLDEETAEESMYALPRGGKPIKGPSIRFAESLKASFGNCRAAARIVHVDRVEKVVIAEGLFHDLETNSATKAEVRRRIVGKNGRLFNDDMIIVTGNAACSIALRNAILGGVPKPVWRKAYDAVQQIIAGDAVTLVENREKALKAFALFGVTPEQVFAALAVTSDLDITIDHIPVLRGMFAALKNGESTVEEMFASPTRAPHEAVVNPLSDDAAKPATAKPAAQSESTKNPAPASPSGAATAEVIPQPAAAMSGRSAETGPVGLPPEDMAVAWKLHNDLSACTTGDGLTAATKAFPADMERAKPALWSLLAELTKIHRNRLLGDYDLAAAERKAEHRLNAAGGQPDLLGGT